MVDVCVLRKMQTYINYILHTECKHPNYRSATIYQINSELQTFTGLFLSGVYFRWSSIEELNSYVI